MDASKRRDLPAGLEGVKRRFERWRRRRRGHARIPDALWAAAVIAAGVHGLNRTVRALRLDYYSLKERVEQQASSAAGTTARAATGRGCLPVPKRFRRRGADPVRAVPAFVELAPPVGKGLVAAPAGCGQCTVEWEDGAGAKMRVELRGTAMPDLAALSHSFWNPGS